MLSPRQKVLLLQLLLLVGCVDCITFNEAIASLWPCSAGEGHLEECAGSFGDVCHCERHERVERVECGSYAIADSNRCIELFATECMPT